MRHRRTALVVLLAIAGARCAGDGTEFGVLEPPPPDEGPTLASIQASVFTPICTECHVPGGIGPMPLDSVENSYASLVDVQSIEVPALKRVNPGDPETSYIVHKIEGRAGIRGTRMPPPPRPMLDAQQIADIREWIANGAEP